ncbi:LOW QUALITY PROTEIN: protein arginine N-methyltransferase 5 [Cuculus canorus]|uniref:LOW QUALITY PROTEIN: protein arginine N-methyltransferase 5 n=1 Tax=Cuculus canorus TaxID=55661 RepID=UPI0023AA8247|nr:LOW QUALITY PROTEIN: protein arginine N-methyltransferase 5 [Cuculus canorus]
MAAAAAAAVSPPAPGAGGGAARVSAGRELGCAAEVGAALGSAARHGFDFLCLPLFHPRARRERLRTPAAQRAGPATRADLLLCGRDWNTLVVGKVSPWIRADSPLEHERRNSECVGCGVPLVAPEDAREDVVENEEAPQVGSRGEDLAWHWEWHNFRTLCDYNNAVGVALEVGPDLPSAAAVARWLGEPVKAAILPTSLFLTNKKGFPVLSRPHQRLLGRLLKLDVQVVLWGAPRHGAKPLSGTCSTWSTLGQHRPPPSAYELFARGYEDYLQSPLQPLMDNLESQTYEVFEKDPVKYSQYQQAIYQCLLDRVPEDEKESNVQVVLVLGAGRGPLVNATLRAARQANRHVRLYAVEKNPNAVVTLESWQYEEWGAQVRVVAQDMREWRAPEPADVLVSELLGSFGDNELCPECLAGAQPCLKADGVSIPCSYTSFLAPISSSKLYNEVRGCRERDRHPEAQFETPYVVRLHNFHQLAPPQPCFTFRHPRPDLSEDNSRYQVLSFLVDVTTVLHGFAGYFETRLYGDITLSIRPETHSPGMFSWFPIFFPIKQPMPVRAGEAVSVAFWRCATPKKVWYEWAVTSPSCSALHNPTGRSYTIGL